MVLLTIFHLKNIKNLKDKKNVEFLNPAELENGFYIEAGWTSVGNKIKVPTKESLWKIGKNKSLNENQNINLQWDNGEGIIFKRSINLDNNYLFKITKKSKIILIKRLNYTLTLKLQGIKYLMIFRISIFLMKGL